MIGEICAHIRNYFPGECFDGNFTIKDGCFTDCDFLSGCYYIEGSRFNDGVHIHPSQELFDESFSGRIMLMNPPRGFLELVHDIDEWRRDNPEGSQQFISEKLGEYSYTRPNRGGKPMNWQTTFKTRLDAYRKAV